METTIFNNGVQGATRLKQKERRDYNAVATYYDQDVTSVTDYFGYRTIELTDPQPGNTVLEVTCGSGKMLPELARRVGANGKVVGFDQSEGMLELAQSKIDGSRLSNVSLLQGDAELLEGLQPQSFDSALSMFGYMYFPNPQQAINRLHSVMKPGGKAVITVWGMPQNVVGLTLPMEAGAQVLAPFPISRLLDTRVMRSLMYRMLGNTKLGGGKSPMSLARPGKLERLMAKAQFKQIHRYEFSRNFVYESLDEYWQVLMGTPARELIKQYSPAQVEEVREVMYRILDKRGHVRQGKLYVPMEAVTVAGVA